MLYSPGVGHEGTVSKTVTLSCKADDFDIKSRNTREVFSKTY